MNKKDKNHIYYNIKIQADDELDLKPLSFSETRVDAILDNPLDYEIAVERFKLPLINLPIFIWVPNKFSVKMTYDGAEVTEILQFIPNTTGTDIYGDSIWNYQELLDSLNNALGLAYTALKILKPAAPPTEAPFMTFNADTGLMSWNIEQLYSDTTKVFLNQPLYFLFVSFHNMEQDFLGERWYNLLARDNFNNTATINGKAYYSTLQEYRTIALWGDLESVTFQTQSIPVSAENLPSQKDITRNVLTDFEPQIEINNRQSLQYYPQGPLRWYDLKGTTPLRTIDLKVYWQNKNGKQYVMYINNENYFSMKILFRKKIQTYP